MHSFVDKNGRSWAVVVNIAAVKRVRALCSGLNILELISVDENGKTDSSTLDKLSNDPVLLVDTLYAVCKPEADANNITDEQFGEAMNGDAIERATRAFLDEMVDFFPETKRLVLRKVLDATRRFEEETTKKIQAFVESGSFDRLIESRIKTLKDTGLNLPASSE